MAARKIKVKSWDEYPLVLEVKHMTELTGMHQQTIIGALRRGEIPSRRIGRAYAVDRDAFRIWLRGKEKEDG